MKPAILALAGGTALVAAIAGWELRSQWLASTLKILANQDAKQTSLDDRSPLHLPPACGGYRRVSVTDSGRQQIYAKGKELISLFLPGSTAADIAAAPGWSTERAVDGSTFYTLKGQKEHCAVAFVHENQPVVLASRITTQNLIAFAEQLKLAMREAP